MSNELPRPEEAVEIRLARLEEEEACWEIEGQCWSEFHAEPIESDYYDPKLHVVALLGGRLIATGNAVPFDWDGQPEHLPAGGWGQVQRDWVARVESGRSDHGRNACALGISILPEFQGRALGLPMLAALREQARLAGYEALAAPVRPSAKFRFPDLSYGDYAQLRLADGQHFDPWLRLHERAGGRIIAACEQSFRMRGSHADWEQWTGMRLPLEGRLLVTGGNEYLQLADGQGEIVEGSIWVLHTIGRS